MADVVEQMTGIIPVVVTGGVVMKFTDAMLGTTERTMGTSKKKKKSKLTSPKVYYNSPF